MLSKKQLATMFELQNKMNSRVVTDWRSLNRPWTDAIFTEATEAFNHLHWEWWKDEGRPADYEQVKLELVDVWHFMLSLFMSYEKLEGEEYQLFSLVEERVTEFFTFLIENKNEKAKSDEALFKKTMEETALRSIISSALEPGEFIEQQFVKLLTSFLMALKVFDIGHDELFKLYVGKNTLNQFRQANGYKTDAVKYKQIWQGGDNLGEDNEFLTEALKDMDIESDTFVHDLTVTLALEFNTRFPYSNVIKAE